MGSWRFPGEKTRDVALDVFTEGEEPRQSAIVCFVQKRLCESVQPPGDSADVRDEVRFRDPGVRDHRAHGATGLFESALQLDREQQDVELGTTVDEPRVVPAFLSGEIVQAQPPLSMQL